MTRNTQEDAVQTVLSSPDLVTLILERLPVPQLGFGTTCRETENRDRWAASQVSAIFRSTALRLPWEALWGLHRNSESAASLKNLGVLKSRNVQSWHVQLGSTYRYVTYSEQANRDAAAVLNYARDTKRLTVASSCELAIENWLHHTLVPLPGAKASSKQGNTVLASLATLSRLTSLQVCPDSGRSIDASWLTMMTQLKSVDLWTVGRPPVKGLPALESVCLSRSAYTQYLQEWASPWLTALTYQSCILRLGLPSDSEAAQEQASGSNARLCFSTLRRLELKHCSLTVDEASLRDPLPSLTYLALDQCSHEHVQYGLTPPFFYHLPTGLKDLYIHGTDPVWEAVFKLHGLVSFRVWLTTGFALDDMAAVVTGLMHLPHLKHVFLRLPVGNRALWARAEEGFQALGALLLKRQGRLWLCVDPGWGG